MYKVFFNSSAIIIGGQLTMKGSSAQRAVVADKRGIFLFLDDFLHRDRRKDTFLTGFDADDLFNGVKSYFHYMEAAGGLVRNKAGAYLFIRRLGIWDLPKGKIEKNESPGETAIREVREETGLPHLIPEGELSATYHIYRLNNRFVLKKTFWFLMFSKSKTPLRPQAEEGITEALWLDKEKSKQAIETSYRSLKENFLPFFQD
ncbi:MAG: NUDIX domain-containing protein [Bacteroidales bacterium]|nr:NUDIX domain-containing protein [Bacteroidales bacterium]MCF6342386.1 NUDIX domain-containing protein [Bacteroidales bacterium]